MRRLNARWVGLFVVAVGFALLPARVLAQAALTPETMAGTYKGTATGPDGAAVPMTVELRVEKGSLVGSGQTDHGPFTITSATITGDKVSMTMDFGGAAGTLTGTVKDTHVEGTWTVGEMSGSYALTKAAPADAAVGKPQAPPSAAAPALKSGDPITGTWDGVTGQGDQSIGFVLALKLDGDKVTGDVGSEQGSAAISTGTWKDGTLTFTFEYGGMGMITMVAGLKEGKLVGTLDVGGQMQMPWAAVKRGAGL